MVDTSFDFPMEGHFGSSNWVIDCASDDTEEVEYGPNAPFFRTSMFQ